MPWYMTDDARRDARKPGATIYPSLATVTRLARDSGAVELADRPGEFVLTRHQLYAFTRLLAVELRAHAGERKEPAA